MCATAVSAVEESPSPLPGSDEPTAEGGSEGWGEGGGAMVLIAPPPTDMLYSTVRFGYAANGRAESGSATVIHSGCGAITASVAPSSVA